MTYSYNPAGLWTATQQMTMNGKRDGFTLADFEACAKLAQMKRGRAAAILDEARAAGADPQGSSVGVCGRVSATCQEGVSGLRPLNHI